jgi:hypothetical protein
MKKLLLTILAFFILTVPSFAVGTIAVTNDNIYYNSDDTVAFRVTTITFTADAAAGTIPDLEINDSTTGMIGPTKSILGWYGYFLEIDCNHSGTEPTEDSEIYIYQSGIDLLGGNGVNQVDNTTEREVFFYFGSTKVTRPFYDTLTVRITQQAAATNSATGTIRIISVP